MRDRNEWFKEVERAYSKLKIVERPYAPPHAAVAVEAEDVLCCLGLHPHISASDWLVINLDEVSELIELIRPVPVTGATSDGGRSGNSVCAYMGYEFVNTLFTDEWYSDVAMKERGVVQIPLCYLAKSLENMSLCHAAYFCKGWENARGCRIEHDMSVTCPSCGMSNSIAWGSLMATPQKEAVAMLADSWNSR